MRHSPIDPYQRVTAAQRRVTLYTTVLWLIPFALLAASLHWQWPWALRALFAVVLVMGSFQQFSEIVRLRHYRSRGAARYRGAGGARLW